MPRTIPDALGIRGRAQIAFQELHSLQHRLMMLEAQRQDGGHDETDVVANPEASGRTFAQERTRLEGNLKAWADRHAHLVAAVENIIKRNERAAEAQEKAEATAAK